MTKQPKSVTVPVPRPAYLLLRRLRNGDEPITATLERIIRNAQKEQKA